MNVRLLPRALRRLPLSACLLVAMLAIPAYATAGDGSTNQPAHFSPISDLLRKWNEISLDKVQHAAESGDLEAQHYLAYCYAEGLRVTPEPSLAVSWYERAGNAGYLPSLNNLGLLYQRGKGVPQNLAKAQEYYRRAAEAGLPRAQANLGFLYKDGIGVERDLSAAMRWFRLAADNGLSTGMVEIGRLFRFGQGVPKDSEAAEAWFQKAADKGDPLGEFNLALLYESEGDEQRGFRHSHAAAEHGNADAMTSLYFAYLRGKGVAADKKEAAKWLTKSAEAGSAYGQCLLGYRYENPEWEFSPEGNHLPPPNMVEAVRWYRRSAEQNWSGGQYRLGLCYLDGNGVEQDEERGLQLIRNAADQSQTYAMAELADCYARGIGSPRSEDDKPLAIFQRVINSGAEDSATPILHAYWSIILRHEYGIGTERDALAAVQWQCRAALAGVGDFTLSPPERRGPRPIGFAYTGMPGRTIIAVSVPDSSGRTDAFYTILALYLRAAHGDARAAKELGDVCLDGVDTPKSSRQAWLWFSLAAQNGDSEAGKALSRCETAMTAEELNAAKRQQPELLNQLAAIRRQAGP